YTYTHHTIIYFFPQNVFILSHSLFRLLEREQAGGGAGEQGFPPHNDHHHHHHHHHHHLVPELSESLLRDLARIRQDLFRIRREQALLGMWREVGCRVGRA